MLFQIIIGIHSTATTRLHSSQVPARPISTTRSQNTMPPPPYPGTPIEFCTQCGVSRSSLAANFCSSCGYAFNKY